MSKCSIEGCSKKYECCGYCNMHYLRWLRSGQAGELEPRKRSSISHEGSSVDYYRFNGNRERVIQRDNEQCVMCRMTRQNHKEKWGRDITVDHVDNQGRYSETKNHDLDNLQTLCLACHGRKDVMTRYEYKHIITY